MLAADKQALTYQLKQQSLQVRQKELDFFLSNFGTVAGQAAMLAGFSFTGFTINFNDMEGMSALDNPILRASFYVVSSMSLGFFLLTVSNCALCTIYGPNLALRGPDGSMDRAVRILQRERTRTFAFFGVGLVCFHVSAILLSLLIHHLHSSLPVTITLVAFLFAFFFYGSDIYHNLLIPEDAVVSGQFKIGGYSVGEGKHATDEHEAHLSKLMAEHQKTYQGTSS